tara:strand:+ start:1400 stop:1873 length:474 start_codon:yes stop_codon:yes gene_type:complete
MEKIYQERIEKILNSTLNEIMIYSVFAYLVSLFVEMTMPRVDENKDSPSLIMEIIVQLVITISAFMFMEIKIPARYGILAYIIVAVSVQQNFMYKISLLNSRIINRESNKEGFHIEDKSEEEDIEKNTNESNEQERIHVYGDGDSQEATPISSLPMY